MLWFIYIYKLFGPRDGLLLVNESKQSTYKSRFITEMNKTSTQQQDLTLEQHISQIVDPRWARPKTEHQAPSNVIESFYVGAIIKSEARLAGVYDICPTLRAMRLAEFFSRYRNCPIDTPTNDSHAKPLSIPNLVKYKNAILLLIDCFFRT